MRLDEYFPPERVAAMQAYLRSFAARFGIDDFVQRDRIPNTRRALVLAEVARDEGQLDAFRKRAMDAHWRDGMNLEDDADLRAIAGDAGLASGAVERSAREPLYLRRIEAIRAEATAAGIDGIPTFILGNLALSGAQPYETFQAFAERAGATRR